MTDITDAEAERYIAELERLPVQRRYVRAVVAFVWGWGPRHALAVLTLSMWAFVVIAAFIGAWTVCAGLIGSYIVFGGMLLMAAMLEDSKNR